MQAEAAAATQACPTVTDAVGCLVATLSALADHPMDVSDLSDDEAKARYVEWRERVEMGGSNGAVDWQDLTRFLVESRRKEQDKVNRNVRELRSTISFLIASVQQSIVEDVNQDDGIAGQLNTLEQAVGGSSVEDLRKAATSIISATTKALEERRARHAKQLQAVRNPRARRAAASRDADPLVALLEREAFENELVCRARLAPSVGRTQCILLLEATPYDRASGGPAECPADDLLRPAAERCRRVFSRVNDAAARLGEAMIGIIADVDCDDTGFRLAQRLLLWIREIKFALESQELGIHVSLGLATQAAGEPADGWLARAQEALSTAKSEGGNRLIVADFD